MTGIPPLRKNRSFQLLWIGSTASEMGSAVTALALPLLILALTGSPALAGIAATCQLAARVLLGLPAGVLVDRLDRRRILLSCEALRLAALGLFASLVFWEAVTFWHILAVATIHGGASAFYRPAHAAAIQAVVPRSQLPSAYAQEQARSYAATLAGPPLGGALFAISRALPFLADTISYLVSLICVVAAKVPRRAASTTHESTAAAAEATGLVKRNMRSDLSEALQWLWARGGLRAAIGLAVFSNVLTAAVLIPVIVLVDERGGDPVTTGAVLTGLGVGGLLGALAARWICKLLPPGKLMLVVHVFMALGLCATTLPFGPWWPAVPLALAWVAVPAINVVLSALIGQLVPGEMMGRINSLIEVAVMSFAPFGPVIGGLLAASFGGSGSLLAIGLSLLFIVAIASTSSALRGLEPLVMDEREETEEGVAATT